MSGRYAAGTTVSVDRSVAEIQTLVRRFGATRFVSGWDAATITVGFELANRQVKIVVGMPDPGAREYTLTSHGLRRSATEASKRYDQACRERMRALVLVLKAKLAGIEAGITTVEREFLADLLLPTGQTVGEWAGPQLESLYAAGAVPPMLPSGPAR